MCLRTGDRVKFTVRQEDNVIKIGHITDIDCTFHALIDDRKTYTIQTDDGEVYLNVEEYAIISYFPDQNNSEIKVDPDTVIKSKYEYKYKLGDCVHIRSMHSKSVGIIMMDGIVLGKSDTTITLIDLIGTIHTFHSVEMIITANFGNIDLPGFGIVDGNNIPNPSDFKYRLGDIVSIKDDGMKVGQISGAMYSVTDSCVKYLIQPLNKYDEPGTWIAFDSITPGDYRMKEQQTDTESEDDYIPKTNCIDKAKVEVGDCVYLEHKSDEEIKGDFIITYILGNKIELLSLTGIHYFVYKENVKITANMGSIFIPGVGYSRTELFNKGKIDTDAFMYRLGDIVTVKATKRVGKIADAYFSSSNGCVAYKIDYFDNNEDEYIVWQPYTNIEPGDYRMKEQENKITMDDIRNCFDDDFDADDDKYDDEKSDEESGLSVYRRCDECPAMDILNINALAGYNSSTEFYAIRFDKPEITIFYSGGGESNVELPKNAYNKKVGFLLAYLKGILDDEEYARVIGVMKSINKEPQQVIKFDETCDEDD